MKTTAGKTNGAGAAATDERKEPIPINIDASVVWQKIVIYPEADSVKNVKEAITELQKDLREFFAANPAKYRVW